METTLERVRRTLEESNELRARMLASPKILEDICSIAESIMEIYTRGGKLLIAGNGGSAADAQHFAAEITCQYVARRKARPAIALHTDTSAMTAWANDHSFTTGFARLIEAYGNRGDGLVLISTSGNSENLIESARAARGQGLRVFGLLGKGGGKLLEAGLCDNFVVVPSDSTARIQEMHITIVHMICDELDRLFLLQDGGKQ